MGMMAAYVAFRSGHTKDTAYIKVNVFTALKGAEEAIIMVMPLKSDDSLSGHRKGLLLVGLIVGHGNRLIKLVSWAPASGFCKF